MLTNHLALDIIAFAVDEAWLSLVERCVRDAEAAGSNPVASTESLNLEGFRRPEALFFFVPQVVTSGYTSSNSMFQLAQK